MLINTISYFFALDIIHLPAQNVSEHFEIHSAYFAECLGALQSHYSVMIWATLHCIYCNLLFLEMQSKKKIAKPT